MPLTPNEALTLSPRVTKLVNELREAVNVDGDGGKRVTGPELRRIVSAALALVTAVVIDVLD